MELLFAAIPFLTCRLGPANLHMLRSLLRKGQFAIAHQVCPCYSSFTLLLFLDAFPHVQGQGENEFSQSGLTCPSSKWKDQVSIHKGQIFLPSPTHDSLAHSLFDCRRYPSLQQRTNGISVTVLLCGAKYPAQGTGLR